MPNSRPAAKCRLDGLLKNSTNRLAFLRIAPGLFHSARGVFFGLWNLCGGRLVFDVTPSGDTRMDFIRIIIAIILPPLGVFLQVGFGGAFWLNILLTLLGYIPGIVHAVYIIAKR